LKEVVFRLELSYPGKNIGTEREVAVQSRWLESANDELTRFQKCVGRCLSSSTPLLKVLTSRQGIGFAHFGTRLIDDGEFAEMSQECPSSLTLLSTFDVVKYSKFL